MTTTDDDISAAADLIPLEHITATLRIPKNLSHLSTLQTRGEHNVITLV